MKREAERFSRQGAKNANSARSSFNPYAGGQYGFPVIFASSSPLPEKIP